MTFQEMVQEIPKLSTREKKKLMYLLIDEISSAPAEEKYLSLSGLRGLGKEIWKGIDAQEYVNQLRSEWDHRP